MSTPINTTLYESALQRERLHLAQSIGIDFESMHPRDWKGAFKKKLTGMARGEQRSLPSGVTVEKKYANYKVTEPGGKSQSPKSLQETVDVAMRFDAATKHEQSIGGARSTTVADAVKDAKGSIPPDVARSAFEKMGLQHNHLLDNQLANARDSILERVDPPNKPPAKDGREALQRLKSSYGGTGLGRGSSYLPTLDENWPDTTNRIWEAIQSLRGRS